MIKLTFIFSIILVLVSARYYGPQQRTYRPPLYYHQTPYYGYNGGSVFGHHSNRPSRPSPRLMREYQLHINGGQQEEEGNIDEDGVELEEGANNALLQALAWKTTAAEYAALYYQGFNIAKWKLMEAMESLETDKIVVFADVDDTLLEVTSYWGFLVQNNVDWFDDCIWDSWIPEDLAVPTPGALDFMNWVNEQGIDIYYVTSRNQGALTNDFALSNLRSKGFPQLDSVEGENPVNLVVLRETSNKERFQNEIFSAGEYQYQIKLGDNLNDFSRIYRTVTADLEAGDARIDARLAQVNEDKLKFGEDYVLFPNPTDGGWLRAAFGSSEPEGNNTNRNLRKQFAERHAWDGNVTVRCTKSGENNCPFVEVCECDQNDIAGDDPICVE